MGMTPRETAFRHFFAACAVAVFVTGGSAAATAHGGGSHHDGGSHGDMARLGSNALGGRSIEGVYWDHHHHHPGNGPGGLGTVHGPGSSHNPIVYRPPVRPVRPPVASVGPAKLPKSGRNRTFCELQRSGVDVRDHRSASPRCVRGGAHH
jgi:hypothetical protein